MQEKDKHGVVMATWPSEMELGSGDAWCKFCECEMLFMKGKLDLISHRESMSSSQKKDEKSTNLNLEHLNLNLNFSIACMIN